MTSEEFERTSSSLGEGTSSTSAQSSGISSKDERQRDSGASMEKPRRRRTTVRFRNDGSPRLRRRTRAASQRPIFRAPSIDPAVDRAIVADAVDFVVSASSQGCVSLVSKIAEHLKYKISLEEKVISLSRELEKLKSQTVCFPTVTVHSQMQTKSNMKEMKQDDYEIILPGVVPHSFKTRQQQNSLKCPPTITISDFQDKSFSAENMSSLLQISPKKEPSKSHIDGETQTDNERKPVMVDKGCSAIPQVKDYRDIETQTRNAKLIERGCSPDLEMVTQLQHWPEMSESKNKICSPIPNKKAERNTQKSSSGNLRQLPGQKSRPHSALSGTDHSAKSFPGVKSRCDKCPCTTCVKIKKKAVQNENLKKSNSQAQHTR